MYVKIISALIGYSLFLKTIFSFVIFKKYYNLNNNNWIFFNLIQNKCNFPNWSSYQIAVLFVILLIAYIILYLLQLTHVMS